MSSGMIWRRKRERSKGRVLVLGTDDRVILAVARSLGRRGLTVDLAWCSPTSIAAKSRYVATTHHLSAYVAANDHWKRELVELLSRESYDLVIPCNDSTLVPLVANRGDFAAFPQIHLLSDDVFSVVSDKFKTYELAQQQGVSVPLGRVVDGTADPDELIRDFGIPLVFKPQATITAARTSVANVVKKIDNREELIAMLKGLGSQRVLVQENFSGRGVGVEMLVHKGDVLFAFQHARLHETVEWGSSYRRSVPISPELLDAARKMMKAVEYTGAAMAEFIVDSNTGRWVFLEINGRFWGSLPLAVAAGADFPYYLYQMLVEGKREFASGYSKFVYCRNLPLDFGWMKTRFMKTRTRQLLAPFRILGELGSVVVHGDHLDSFSIDDPRPLFAELSDIAAKAFRKFTKLFDRGNTSNRPPSRSNRRHRELGFAAKVLRFATHRHYSSRA